MLTSANSKRSSSAKLKSIRSTLNQFIEKRQIAKSNRSVERKKVKQLEKYLKNLFAVQSHVQRTAQDCQQEVHQKIAAVVSRSLSSVFADPYSFQISFVRRRGKTDAVLTFYRDGHEIDPVEAAGFGPVDIASFALRIACILCSRPRLRKFIILDEPFKHLQKNLIPLAGQMVYELACELDIQIVIITHHRKLIVKKAKRHRVRARA